MAQHPLEPLSGDEFRQTADILRRDQDVTDSWRFASIELKEPPKQDVKTWKPGDPVGLGRHVAGALPRRQLRHEEPGAEAARLEHRRRPRGPGTEQVAAQHQPAA